jgi:hypothetical protein
MMGKQGKRRRLDDLKERRRYWKLKEEALDRTVFWKRLWTCHKTDCGMNE